MLIFIIGYMGAGKTTLGKKLAAKLGYNFLDLDEMIIEYALCSIAEIFEKYGETTFREKEREILLSLLDDKETVIATGGGTPCFADNMDLMNQKGITIFMDTHLETILERIKAGMRQRPLLKDIPDDKLPEFIKGHLESRMKYYTKAKIRLTGFDDEIIPLLKCLANSI